MHAQRIAPVPLYSPPGTPTLDYFIITQKWTTVPLSVLTQILVKVRISRRILNHEHEHEHFKGHASYFRSRYTKYIVWHLYVLLFMPETGLPMKGL